MTRCWNFILLLSFELVVVDPYHAPSERPPPPGLSKLVNLIAPTERPIPGFSLHQSLFRGYNKYILPVEAHDHPVEVRLLLELVSLTDIDEKNQIMTTQVWIRHEWRDCTLNWEPTKFNNITKMNLPADDLWLPDTVLYNNADGDYQITTKTKVKLFHDGRVVWLPPAIYKSFCAIDVKFFPFDEQNCELKFGPWTYDISKVDYWLYDVNNSLTDYLPLAADMADYSKSVEWDILDITGKRSVWQYPCCPERYVDITYKLHVRRKTLFYTINLIIPWLLISFLTIFVFYLPSQSGEKITLSISILVSMTFFILTLYEIIPPTSLALPLMSKYLLFTMLLVTTSIVTTVLILTLHFRHAHAFAMPEWVRRLFLNYLPRVLFSESPSTHKWYRKKNPPKLSKADTADLEPLELVERGQSNICEASKRYGSASMLQTSHRDELGRNVFLIPEDDESVQTLDVDDIKLILRDVKFISMKYQENTEEIERKAEWQAFARVMDRLFLYIYGATVSLGTYAIFASAPGIYDSKPAIA